MTADCSSSKFEVQPQHNEAIDQVDAHCSSSKFEVQPQLSKCWLLNS